MPREDAEYGKSVRLWRRWKVGSRSTVYMEEFSYLKLLIHSLVEFDSFFMQSALSEPVSYFCCMKLQLLDKPESPKKVYAKQ